MSPHLEQRLEQQLKVTPQIIIAGELLALPMAGLEQAIREEEMQNPALEVIEKERCPRCGTPLRNQVCPACTDRGRVSEEREGWNYQDYRKSSWDDGDDSDPLSRVAAGPSLSEYLLWQLGPVLETEQTRIAEYIVGSLDSRGLLTEQPAEIAQACACSQTAVEAVLKVIQTCEPWGIGARSPRESLLCQLAHLEELSQGNSLARAIVSNRWNDFLQANLTGLVRGLGVSEGEVRSAITFIRENLHPYPAAAFWSIQHAEPASEAQYIRPDIAVRRRPAPDEGFEVEVLAANAYSLRIDPSYRSLAQRLKDDEGPEVVRASEQVDEWIARAHLFIRCVRQRWQTLQMIGDALVNQQADFLRYGDRSIRKMTRAALAEQIGVHESTVSRAVAHKYAQLPDGRIIAIADFFDDSLAAKDVMTTIIRGEPRPLSDQEVSHRMALAGYPIARRTVAKYRQELRILPARLRGCYSELA